MIKPLNDYVLLEVEPSEKKVGNIIITTKEDKHKSHVARVVAVGVGKLKDGQREPISLNIGDRVIYREYSTTDYEEGDKKYLLVQADDILAIVE